MWLRRLTTIATAMVMATRNLITLATAMRTGHRMRRCMAASASTAAGVGPAVTTAATGMATTGGMAETDGMAAVAGTAVAAAEVPGAAAAVTEDTGIERRACCIKWRACRDPRSARDLRR